ncbi:glycosyltransferase family 2 protein [Pigmentibacter sp. JX0631]|uniref:glycosyltransferase family 2 protein n=1 Tax=Pigmentibacter sp. JX0631 TaxID=2976982 RepID=UPI002469571E|nr:glycosyltransferase family 2 protein [Pigmentibacter sp. JX0631]WGL60849.1 glycosyltransferase family 2 protein [Pigmentibacter sp. JX0631]
MNELVSIAIPSYNCGKFIKFTIESLLRQTYSNIEIIVSDNCSTDDSSTIVSDFCRKDSRVKFFKNETNIGYTKNISSAIEKTNGKYVAIYHADDIYSEKIIEKQYNVLLNYSEVNHVFTQLNFLNSEKNIIKNKNYNFLYNFSFEEKAKLLIGDLNSILPVFLEYGNFLPCPSYMTRKSSLLKNLFDDDFPTNEDLNAWLKILKNGEKIAFVMEPLLNYRIHEQQGSSAIRKNCDLDVMYKCLDSFISKNSEINISNKTMEFYKMNKSFSYLRAAMRALDAGNEDLSKLLVTKSKKEYQPEIYTKLGFAQNFLKMSYILNKMLKNIKVSL